MVAASLPFLFGVFASLAAGHSWVEQLSVVAANDSFVGAPGFPRGNVLRSAAGFSDNTMVNLIPPNGRSTGLTVLSTDPMCRPSQQNPTQTDGSPRLQALAGNTIALRYQENGHVSLPDNQPGKPKNRGTIYIYGTSNPSPQDTLLGIHRVWNQDGTGGDKRGVLLAQQNFDDARCRQINSGAISRQRQQEFPHTPDKLQGADLWCQNNIALPTDLPTGKPYTLYWVWDWPTAPGTQGFTNGKPEFYTTCMDVDITGQTSPNPVTRIQANAKDFNDVSGAIPTHSNFDGASVAPLTNFYSYASGASAAGSSAATASVADVSALPTTLSTSTRPVRKFRTTYTTVMETVAVTKCVRQAQSTTVTGDCSGPTATRTATVSKRAPEPVPAPEEPSVVRVQIVKETGLAKRSSTIAKGSVLEKANIVRTQIVDLEANAVTKRKMRSAKFRS